MRNGIFVVLEGGEGTGKTTQVARMKDYLPTRFPDREFVFTREPGGSVFGQKIRELIFSAEAKEANGRTLFGFFVADRADHVEKVIAPALAEGKVVICDRYLAATYAYQVVAQQDPLLEELFWMHTKLMPHPDLTLLFDMEPAAALERVSLRGGERTHFDERDLAFHERIRAGFKEYFDKAPGSAVASIDASRSGDEVWNQAYGKVVSIL